MRFFKRLKAYLWFRFVIQSNEFHKSLDINMDAVLSGRRTLDEEILRVDRLRRLAHRMDLET